MRDWLRVALVMFGIGWGANQFAPMLLVYRQYQQQSESAVAAMLGAYAIGLVPALLVAGGYSDRHGRRSAVRLAAVLSVAASAVLIAGVGHPVWLYLGRLLAGVATGAVMAAGSPWVRQLSRDAAPGAGARRTAVALSGGFGAGPVVAGLVAQWAPWPLVLPYLVHIALMLAIIPGMRSVPDTHSRATSPAKLTLITPTSVRPQFLIGVGLWAPLVFGTATISFATLPSQVSDATAGLPIAFSGSIAGVTLLAGIGVQPAAQRLNQRSRTLATVCGLALAAFGLLAGAGVSASTASARVLAVPVVAAVLGSAYGALLVSGLVEVEHLGGPEDHGALVAIYYALTYVGFAVPYLLTRLEPVAPIAFWLVLAAAGALLMIPAKALVGHAET